MLRRVTITFAEEEYVMLEIMANDDLRLPRDQLRWLVREAAQSRGLLSQAEETSEPSGKVERATLPD